MKDCSDCPHRVDINPAYKDMNWDELPCATCKVITTPNQSKTVQYNEAAEDNNCEPLGVLIHEDVQGNLLKLHYVMWCWVQLTCVQRKMMTEFILRPELDKKDIAKLCGVSKQRLDLAFKSIIKRFPELSGLLRTRTRMVPKPK